MGARATISMVPRGMLVLLVALKDEGPLDLETRRRIYLTVNRFPGLGLADVARHAGVSEDLVRYHVRVLEKAGLARSQEEGGQRRVYPMQRTQAGSASPLGEEERRMLALLRRPPILRAVVALLDEDPRTAGQLADACGVSPSTMSHHLRSMEKGGVVHTEREGRERYVFLARREMVTRLLAEHPPPRDLVQGFIETWEGLGF